MNASLIIEPLKLCLLLTRLYLIALVYRLRQMVDQSSGY